MTARWTRTRVTNTSPPRVVPAGSARRRPRAPSSSRPLTSAWTKRKNGRSNRKNPMSRPKTGSVTARRRRERHAVDHSRIVSHAPADRPRDAERDEDREQRRRPRCRSGRCRACPPTRTRTSGRRAGRGRTSRTPVPPEAGVVLRAALRIGEAVRPGLEQPGPGRVRGRHEAAGEPEGAEQHDERDREARRRTARAAPRGASRGR